MSDTVMEHVAPVEQTTTIPVKEKKRRNAAEPSNPTKEQELLAEVARLSEELRALQTSTASKDVVSWLNTIYEVVDGKLSGANAIADSDLKCPNLRFAMSMLHCLSIDMNHTSLNANVENTLSVANCKRIALKGKTVGKSLNKYAKKVVAALMNPNDPKELTIENARLLPKYTTYLGKLRECILSDHHARGDLFKTEKNTHATGEYVITGINPKRVEDGIVRVANVSNNAALRQLCKVSVSVP